MSSKASRGWWCACVVGLASACSAAGDTSDGGRRGGDSGGDATVRDVPRSADGPPLLDASPAMDALPDSRAGYCMGAGPPVTVGDSDGGGSTCIGSVAARLFANAVCSCTNANVVGYFRTRSFASAMGGMLVAEGGPVGLDSTYTSGSDTDIGGTFTVSGTSNVNFAGYLAVGGDLLINAGLNAVGYITVHRDAWIEGNANALAYFHVGRDLHQPAGRSLPLIPSIGGSTVHTPFTVATPCDCAPADLLDVGGIVADASVHNDNAAVSLDPAYLSSVIGIGVDLTLPCGRFYVNSIGGLGGITLHVDGRTALFVGGDVNAIGAFNVHLGPMGELDLFIAGNLLSIGAGSFGNPSRPAATRIYVGGSGDVTLVGASGFVGNVYAPHSRITAVGGTTVYGSVFGRVIDMPGYLEVHYDRSVLDVGGDCPPVGTPTCTQCGGTCAGHHACVGGSCGNCRSDSDCCAPLVCYPDGTCGELIG